MGLTTAVSGFVVFLVSLSVSQLQNDWRVTYTSQQICAVRGSTVDISCTFTYPTRIKNKKTEVQSRLWFTKVNDNEAVDLKTDPDYKGRVEYHFERNHCTLRIKELKTSDADVYNFRFITNHEKGKYSGRPGVTLSVTDLQVQVIRSDVGHRSTELKCQSSCLSDHQIYIWYKNGQKTGRETSSYEGNISPTDSYSCALQGHENFLSPSVYPPKSPSVSVSPSAEIVEGSSVTLTCSTDANPAAKYTWYRIVNKELQFIHEGPNLVISSIQPDLVKYYCRAVNQLGTIRSEHISVDVIYAPKLPSVSVSPSAEIVEGSSVTLTCSSDANPAANYTWYKENEDSPQASGQNFTIISVRHEHSGYYSCKAQNKKGNHSNFLHLTVVAGAGKSTAAGVTTAVLLIIICLCVFLWIRRKRASKKNQRPKSSEQSAPDQGQPEEQDNLHYASIHFFDKQADPVYLNIRAAQAHRHMEEQEVTEYSAVM